MGNSNTVSAYEMTGIGSSTVRMNTDPSLHNPQLLQAFSVNDIVDMFAVGVPERTPVTGCKDRPAGRAGSDTKDVTYCGVVMVGVTDTLALPRVISCVMLSSQLTVGASGAIPKVMLTERVRVTGVERVTLSM